MGSCILLSVDLLIEFLFVHVPYMYKHVYCVLVVYPRSCEIPFDAMAVAMGETLGTPPFKPGNNSFPG